MKIGVNALQYIASYADLMDVLGLNPQGGVDHYDEYGYLEGRQQIFSGLTYIATYDDLIAVLGNDAEAGAAHYIEHGRVEGRATASFDGLSYIASYSDLITAFGADAEAGAAHYIQYGHTEGRARATFDGLRYIAAYDDLITALGSDATAGAEHYIMYGYTEGRTQLFASYEYLASYSDLLSAYGDDADGAAAHYIQYGRNEGRSILFDAEAYLQANADLRAVFGDDLEAAAKHYIDYGRSEGRQVYYLGAHSDAPGLNVTDAAGLAGQAIALSITAALTDVTEILSITISDVPTGAVLSAGTNNHDGSWTLTAGDLAGLTVSPAAGSSADFSLHVVASSQAAGAVPATSSADISIIVEAPPVLTIAPASGVSNDAAIALSIQVALGDVDGNDALGDVLISGVPDSFTLNRGMATDDGLWLVSAADLAGLALIPSDPAAVGVFTLHIEASATVSDTTLTATGAGDLTVTITPAAGLAGGQAIDGYIAGATVFADHNGNRQFDPGEAFATTRADGTFVLAGADPGDPLFMFGGTDTLTGLPFQGKLGAAGGSSVITPLTSLVLALSQDYGAAAEGMVKTALGLDPLISLASFDPVAGTAGNDVAAAAVLAAGMQVQTTVAQLMAASGGSVGATAIYVALADAIANGGGPIDATNSGAIEQLALNAGLSADAAVGVSTVTAAANASIAAATGAGDGAAVLSGLSQAANIALGSTTAAIGSTDFSDPSATQALQDNHTGTALDTAVQNAPVGITATAVIGTIGSDTIDRRNDIAPVAIDGLDGDDMLHGGSGNDQIYGGAGKDTLVGGPGDDLLDGGPGFDWASYKGATGPITANLADGTVVGDASVGTDTLRGIERIRGTAFDDVFDARGFASLVAIAGTNVDNVNEFEGMGGNDTVYGNGDTRVSYKNATAGVTVDLGSGAHGTAAGDMAGVGVDTFHGGVGQVRGSEFDDVLIGTDTGGPHADPRLTELYEGLGGDDLIDGHGGFDKARYDNFSTGANGISVDMATGKVTGRDAAATAVIGTDTLKSIEGVVGSNAADFYDASGYTAYSALSADQTVNDQGDFNEFEGVGGDDTIIGNGNMRISYIRATAGVTVDTATGIAHGTAAGDAASVGTDTFTGVRQVRGSNFDDMLYGSNPAYTETFDGRGGNDYIDGRGGNDRVRYDTLDVTGPGVSIDLGAGTVTGRDAAATALFGADTLVSIELVTGSYGDDIYDAHAYTGIGSDQGLFNAFEGVGGNDTIIGNGSTRIDYTRAQDGITVLFTSSGSGTAYSSNAGDTANIGLDTFTGVSGVIGSNYDDNLIGSTGNDSLEGGAGNDLIDGNGGNDTARYDRAVVGAVGITVDMAAGTVTSSDATTLAAIGNDTLRHVERIRGTSADDSYDASSFSGSSVNAGSFGNSNRFEGMGGDDLVIGNGQTTLSYSQAMAGVTVDYNAGQAYGTAPGDIAGIGIDTFSGVNGVIGSNFDDIVMDDTNTSHIPSNFILGGGADTVYAKGTADRFTFNAVTDSQGTAFDWIDGFVGGNTGTQDSLTFSGIGLAGGALDYIGGADFSNTGHAQARLVGDMLSIDVNGDQTIDGTNDMVIKLTNLSGTLDQASFQVS